MMLDNIHTHVIVPDNKSPVEKNYKRKKPVIVYDNRNPNDLFVRSLQVGHLLPVALPYPYTVQPHNVCAQIAHTNVKSDAVGVMAY